MPQKTTQAFGTRLKDALDASETAPKEPYGRGKWLEREMASRGYKVSHNAVHKWLHGQSKPRGDALEVIASTLRCDPDWLANGRTPMLMPPSAEAPIHAKGAVLAIAGLVEMCGGRVMFSGDGQPATRLLIDVGRGQVELSIVVPTHNDGGGIVVVVPEPIGSARVIAARANADGEAGEIISLYDLTDASRQSLGGYSIIAVDSKQAAEAKLLSILSLGA